jgi:CelD/BcsL family acetyltransferase involved in cellulose biosynthesis
MLVANWQLLEEGTSQAGDGLRASWRALMERAVTPAGPALPELISPVLSSLGGAELLTVRAGDDLVLALPLARKPFPAMRATWMTPLGNSGLVPIDRHLAAAAWTAALRAEGAPLMLTGIPASGPFWDTLLASGCRLSVLDWWQRAALILPDDFDTWFERNFDRKRRKEYRRLRSRLTEQGRLLSRELELSEDPRPWASDLLELERAGWKGKRGTALAQNAGLARSFPDICVDLHRLAKLRFWSLKLDGRTIATLYAVVERGEAWLGKIAYDESFARYSPGVLLMLDATRSLMAEPDLRIVDSCAIPSHPMIDNIWRDRLPMADVIVAHDGYSAFRFNLLVQIERVRRTLRSAIRSVYLKAAGRKRS